LSFTFPNQLFFKNNISADASGYYMLFEEGFLADLLPAARLPEEFPFLSMTGVPLFRVSEEELGALAELVGKMDIEVRRDGFRNWWACTSFRCGRLQIMRPCWQ
jgi:AraC family transcriptional activator of pobA